MNDTVSVLLATVILYVVFRWLMGTAPAYGGQNSRRQARPTSRRVVTPEMIEKVQDMFPHINHAAIVTDLQRTGSVDITIENILRDGGLPMPPPVVVRALATTSSSPSSSSSSGASFAASSTPSLVQRYRLQEKVTQDAPVEEPPKVWEVSADKRQENLTQRKEFMVLQARKKYLEQQQKKDESDVIKGLPSSSRPQDVYPEADDFEAEPATPEERRQKLLDATQRRLAVI